MEVVFVHHGHGEHMVGMPDSYQIADPELTERGKKEAVRLRHVWPLTDRDAVIASPTRRALQTARLWCEGSHAARFIHPAIGPRQFPSRYDFKTMPCDANLELPSLTEQFDDFLLPADVPAFLWIQGINTAPALLFETWADQFIAWCRKLDKHRVFLVSHEGTIASYLHYLQKGEGRGGRPICPDPSGGARLSV
ncbi:histidine phosphatase family protein [Paenibacillus piri]|uniref:Histidine phosphatase family protein n=1 Tax=Paenibacillus piri TaxID=2547395 RepID=A0A4R5KU38_9BACL|nr:histidine phosphatase family protein [Paenibacillus piri]TDF99226.1 histidine phosphatase family protein [Paenibacillus piri]